MNYLKVYCNLIRKAENRTSPEGYTEKHHTFPKSIFGKNKRVVVLTSREHYIAHVLLEKVYIKRYGLKDQKTIKMTYAHNGMSGNGRYINSYLYEGAKIRMSEAQKGKKPYDMTDEIRRKISKANKGRTLSEESRAKISEAGKGRIFSEETKAKISELHKGRIFSEEHKKKISEAKKGKTHSEQSRRNMSKARKGRIFSEEHKANLSKAGKGKPKSKEQGKMMSEMGKVRWKCLETGFISNTPGLSKYQRARGIDTSQRVRVE